MKKRSRFLTLFYMVLSCVLCSIAVNWVALPNGFVVTGLTGLSMTAASFVGINYALIFYGLTLLMLLCTFLTLGYKEVSNIIFLSVLYPLVLWVLNHVQVEIILQEKLIAVMLFGVIYGVGAGITYRLGYSYGGTDTLAKILKKKVFRAVELKNIMLALEGTIMVVMLSAFSLDVVAYAFVGQIIYINCMNYMVFNLGPKLRLCGADHLHQLHELHGLQPGAQALRGGDHLRPPRRDRAVHHRRDPQERHHRPGHRRLLQGAQDPAGLRVQLPGVRPAASSRSTPSPMCSDTTRTSIGWTMRI